MLTEFFPQDAAMQSLRIAPALLRTEIDYRHAIRLFDAVQGRMTLEQAGPVRQVLAAQFTVDGRIHATARQTTRFIDLASDRPVPTPNVIRNLLQQGWRWSANGLGRRPDREFAGWARPDRDPVTQTRSI